MPAVPVPAWGRTKSGAHDWWGRDPVLLVLKASHVAFPHSALEPLLLKKEKKKEKSYSKKGGTPWQQKEDVFVKNVNLTYCENMPKGKRGLIFKISLSLFLS